MLRSARTEERRKEKPPKVEECKSKFFWRFFFQDSSLTWTGQMINSNLLKMSSKAGNDFGSLPRVNHSYRIYLVGDRFYNLLHSSWIIEV